MAVATDAEDALYVEVVKSVITDEVVEVVDVSEEEPILLWTHVTILLLNGTSFQINRGIKLVRCVLDIKKRKYLAISSKSGLAGLDKKNSEAANNGGAKY